MAEGGGKVMVGGAEGAKRAECTADQAGHDSALVTGKRVCDFVRVYVLPCSAPSRAHMTLSHDVHGHYYCTVGLTNSSTG